MKRLCVYCGSRAGNNPDYMAAATELGRAMAAQGLSMVYGGGCRGLMGAVADAVLDGGCEVVGVIPRFLTEMGIRHQRLTTLHEVETMHERKLMMMTLADGFVGLPGSIGTTEELIETLTWLQLGLHRKPVGVVNVNGFFDPLLAFLDKMVREDLLHAAHRDMLLVERQPAPLFERMRSFVPSTLSKIE